MLPNDVLNHIKIIDYNIKIIDETLSLASSNPSFSDEVKIQIIASNYIIIATAGLIERGVQSILYEYCLPIKKKKTKQYIQNCLKYETTLDCFKIWRLLNKFDKSWGDNFKSAIPRHQKAAINSIKNRRNNIAHGGSDNTGIYKVKQHYSNAKDALNLIHSIVNK